MRLIETHIDIEADRAVVWRAISNLQEYPRWNPFIREAAGEVILGQDVDIVMFLGEKGRQRYRVRLTGVRPQQELRWLGAFKFPGLIDGNHAFLLEQSITGGTRLHHVEAFTGLLVPFVWKGFLLRHLKPAFLALNANLKAYCEGRVLPVHLDGGR